MALTRKFLSAFGIDADKVDEIITAHSETVNALKEERDKYKADAEKLADVQKELDDLKAKEPEANDFKKKYDELKKQYDDYKADVTAKDAKAKKTEAYRKLLKDSKVSEKRIDSILRVSDIDKLELDKDGALKDVDNLKKKIAEEWADFIVKEEQQGAKTSTPPAGNKPENGTKSRAAQLAAEYRKSMYGATDEAKGE